MSRLTAYRVFLDANVLVAAAQDPLGGSSKLLGLSGLTFITNEYALREAWEVLDKREHRLRFHARLETLAHRMEIDPYDAAGADECIAEWPLSDPNDIPILVGAIRAHCDYLVTHDSACFGPYFGVSLAGVTVVKVGKLLAFLQL